MKGRTRAPQQLAKRSATCEACDHEFTLTAADAVTHGERTPENGFMGDGHTCRCPECGHD